MDVFPDLQLDRHFRDFNFCPFSEPTLKAGSGPSQSDLYKLAYLIRKGDRAEEGEFASAVECTLRSEAFQSFQALHGPYGIEYADWFYAKLEQFLGILLYEELWVWGMGEYGEQGTPLTDRPWEEGNGILGGHPALVDPRQLRSAFFPNECGQIDWSRIVHRLAAAKTTRTEMLRKYLRRRAQLVQRKNRHKETARSGSQPPERTGLPNEQEGSGRRERRRSRSVQTRDSIILTCQGEGLDRLESCQRLDQKGVPTTSKMRKAGCGRWEDAWANLDLRNNVQQVFSKTLARAGTLGSAVKG
jgi:hypothetical protein